MYVSMHAGNGVRVEFDSYVELCPQADTPEKRTRWVGMLVPTHIVSK